MIDGFKDRRTEQAFDGIAAKGFPADLLEVVRRKLRMLHRATSLEDLKAPPGNPAWKVSKAIAPARMPFV